MRTGRIAEGAARSPLVRRRAAPWSVTVVAAAAQLMIVVDERVVNVALPAIRADLGMTTATMQWVVTAYLVTFGGLLLPAARLNDLMGRRRMLLAGLVVFTAASLAAGLAGTGSALIAARFLQGAGGAILAPSSLGLIAAAHTDPAVRRRAMGVWGMVTSAGAIAGVVAGGVLTSTLGWRSVMIVNVPIGIAVIVAALAVLVPSSRLPRGTGRVDLGGAILVTGAVAALVFGISEAPALRWASARVVAALAAAVLLTALFVVVESRSASPLLPPALLRIRSVRVANLGLVLFGAVLTVALYLLSLCLQTVHGYSAVQTGLALVPMSILLAAGSILAPRIQEAGMHRLPAYGALVAAAGLGWLALVPAAGGYATAVLPPTLLVGAGFGVVLVPLAGAATAGVDPSRVATASGLLNQSRQLGGAVGLAVVVGIATAVAGAADVSRMTLAGYHVGFASAALLGLAVAAVVARLPADAPRR